MIEKYYYNTRWIHNRGIELQYDNNKIGTKYEAVFVDAII